MRPQNRLEFGKYVKEDASNRFGVTDGRINELHMSDPPIANTTAWFIVPQAIQLGGVDNHVEEAKTWA